MLPLDPGHGKCLFSDRKIDFGAPNQLKHSSQPGSSKLGPGCFSPRLGGAGRAGSGKPATGLAPTHDLFLGEAHESQEPPFLRWQRAEGWGRCV